MICVVFGGNVGFEKPREIIFKDRAPGGQVRVLPVRFKVVENPINDPAFQLAKRELII
jgi:hypothetical protein